MEGIVKFYNQKKAGEGKFGFIITKDSREVYFEDKNVLGNKDLKAGDKVIFDLVNKNNRSCAENIRKKQVYFPYRFYKRQKDNITLQNLPKHNILDDNKYDIAFHIKWTTLTPTAINPSNDYNVRDNLLENDEKHYLGLSKRWLMIDNRLAISPFTVKSAISNGFANLMGGCYRVVKDIVAHKIFEEGIYPYTGKYKRYRVQRNRSFAGIIEQLEDRGDKLYIKVSKVKEVFLDNNILPEGIKKNDKCYAVIDESIKYKPTIKTLRFADGNKNINEKEVYFYGPYSFGRNLELKPGDLGKKHYYRFYEKLNEKYEGEIDKINFEAPEVLKEKVYMGNFSPQSNLDKRKKGTIWYDDLQKLKVGDWIYFQVFGDKIKSIGRNFLFKALFSIDDAIFEGQKECSDINNLCPRCSMFGMTGNSEDDDTPSGYKGRFKSSTLISNEILEEDKKTLEIPIYDSKEKKVIGYIKITNGLKWVSDGKVICEQYLLPILGIPKANKRDIERGYYKQEDGNIKGAKYYLHSKCDIKKIISEIDKLSSGYSHNQRSFAVVAHPGITFEGTVGAENCSRKEIACLFLLLHSPESGHCFKLGLGKALGMGSVKSEITKVWIRDKNYNWVEKDIDELRELIKEDIKKLKDRLYNTLDPKLNLLERELKYPPAVQEIKQDNTKTKRIYYWDNDNYIWDNDR